MQQNNNTQQTFFCRWCNENKTSDHFYMKNGKRNLNKCKSCIRQYYKEYSKTDGYLIAQRKYNYKRRGYDITMPQYNKLLSIHDGKCDICGAIETRSSLKRKFQLSLDHDHKTGTLRGFLCNKCNLLLGFAQDDINVLQNAILYLNKYGQIHTNKDTSK
jgi:hypothetical protein